MHNFQKNKEVLLKSISETYLNGVYLSYMKVIISLIVGIGFIQLVHGQEKEIEADSIPADSVTKEKIILRSDVDYNWGIYGSVGVLFGPNPDEYELHNTISAGFQWKKWDISGFLTIYEGDYELPLIFPNVFRINYVYGGGTLAYQLKNERFWELYGAVSIGHGDLIWEDAASFENLFRDKMWMNHLMLRAEVTPLKFIRFYSSIGYIRMTGLEINELTDSDFSGLALTFGIKAGFYQMKIINKDK